MQRNSSVNDNFFQSDFQCTNIINNKNQETTNSGVYNTESSSVLSNVTSSKNNICNTQSISSISSSSISMPKSPQQSSFSHPSDPTKFHVDNALLSQILVYGFSEYMAILAIQRTRGAGVEQGLNLCV